MAMKKKGYRNGGKVKKMSKGGSAGGRMRMMKKGGAAGGKIKKMTNGGIALKPAKPKSKTVADLRKLAKLTAQLLLELDLGPLHVRFHQLLLNRPCNVVARKPKLPLRFRGPSEVLQLERRLFFGAVLVPVVHRDVPLALGILPGTQTQQADGVDSGGGNFAEAASRWGCRRWGGASWFGYRKEGEPA